MPGKMLLLISLPGMNMTLQKMVVNGDSVTLTAQGQTIPLDEADKKRYQEQAYPFPEVNFGKAGYSLTACPNAG
jgi:hypothetical protein